VGLDENFFPNIDNNQQRVDGAEEQMMENAAWLPQALMTFLRAEKLMRKECQ
jgi:hypothetical protein